MSETGVLDKQSLIGNDPEKELYFSQVYVFNILFRASLEP